MATAGRVAVELVVGVLYRLVQLLGLDLHSFRRAMCGPATLMGDRHPSRLHAILIIIIINNEMRRIPICGYFVGVKKKKHARL